MPDALLPLVAGEGDYRGLALSFNSPFSHLTILLDLLFVGAGALAYWWWRLGGVPARRRALLVGLRAAALMTVLLLLFDPVLVAHRLEPGRHFAVLLFDDSQSMRIPAAGRPRGELLREAYEPFATALRRSHQVALFRFGDAVERLRHPGELDYAARRSDLVGAVDNALRKMGGAAVSAVVLFSDGVQQTALPPDLDGLPRDVPVFTVGTGPDSAWHALEIAGLSVERTPFDRSPVAVRAGVRAEGFAGADAVLEILDGARPVAAAAFALGDGDQSVRLEFVPDRQGFIAYRARVRLAAASDAAKDPIAANDERAFLVDNRARSYRVLYVAGRPGWEHKFARRALDPDPELALASLVRVSGAERRFVFRGENTSLANPLFEGSDDEAQDAPRYDEAVFLRLGLGPDELAAGYPRTAAELFRYDMVVWGDIERAFFSRGQLETTRDFVGRRGGSLLLSGAPDMLGAGGYARSPIEDMLPAALTDAPAPARFRARPTIEGQLSGIFSLAADPAADRALWDGLPPLFGLTRLVGLRAGASALARTADELPLFAWQRYGEGTTALLATAATWRWQLRGDDDTHPRLWRQLVRALVRSAPAPVLLHAGDDALHAGDRARLDFTVRDSLYIRRESLAVQVSLKGPDGRTPALPVGESLAEPGLYSADFSPRQPGLYAVDLQARDPRGQAVAALQEAVLVHPDHREYADARANPGFLARIAAHTGGAHYPLDRLAELPARIPVTDVASRVSDRFHLWHWPPFYALIVLLWGAEWYLRRREGQP